MRLVSFYGNEVVLTEDKRKIDRLKAIGFKEQKPPEKELPKRKEPLKNARKGKADTAGDI